MERNLTSAEIIGQIMLAKTLYNNFPIHSHSLPIQMAKEKERQLALFEHTSNEEQREITEDISNDLQQERITHVVFMVSIKIFHLSMISQGNGRATL